MKRFRQCDANVFQILTRLNQSWMTPSAVFVLTIALQTKFSANLRVIPTTSTHVLSTSRKHTARFIVKSLRTACFWPSCHCIPAQKFVSVLAELNHNRSPWMMDSYTRVCAVTTSLHSLYELDRIDSRNRVDEGVTVMSCRINRLFFAVDLVLLAYFQQGLQRALDRFSAVRPSRN